MVGKVAIEAAIATSIDPHTIRLRSMSVNGNPSTRRIISTAIKIPPSPKMESRTRSPFEMDALAIKRTSKKNSRVSVMMLPISIGTGQHMVGSLVTSTKYGIERIDIPKQRPVKLEVIALQEHGDRKSVV